MAVPDPTTCTKQGQLGCQVDAEKKELKDIVEEWADAHPYSNPTAAQIRAEGGNDPIFTQNDVGRTEPYSPRGRSHDASSVGAVAVAELVVELPRIVVVEAQAVADLVRQGHHVADGVLAGKLQPGRKKSQVHAFLSRGC